MLLRLVPLGNGSDARALAARGLFESQREPQAIAVVQSLLRDEPDHYQARYLLGQIYASQGEIWNAMLQFGRVLKAHPRHRDTLRALGDLHFGLNALDAAERCYRRILDEDRRDASAWLRVASVKFARAAYKDAMSDYRRAVRYDPTLATAGFSLGDYYGLLRTVRPRSRRG